MCRYYLNNAIQGCGGMQAFNDQWLVNVDKDIIKAFQELEMLG